MANENLRVSKVYTLTGYLLSRNLLVNNTWLLKERGSRYFANPVKSELFVSKYFERALQHDC
jgi:hypothetical protein